MVMRLVLVLVSCFIAIAGARADGARTSGQWIELTTAYSTRLSAYESGPKGASVDVLVVPDIWGIDATVRAWVDHLGGLGVHAVVVDYYDGRMVTSSPMAREVYRSIDPVWIREDIKAGLRYLERDGGRLVMLAWGKGALEAVRFVDRNGIGRVRALLVYDDQRSVEAIARYRLDLPVFEVTTRFSLVDPDHPPRPVDLESTWRSTERFLNERLGLPTAAGEARRRH